MATKPELEEHVEKLEKENSRLKNENQQIKQRLSYLESNKDVPDQKEEAAEGPYMKRNCREFIVSLFSDMLRGSVTVPDGRKRVYEWFELHKKDGNKKALIEEFLEQSERSRQVAEAIYQEFTLVSSQDR